MDELEPLFVPPSATGSGTSTGTTVLTVTGVTGIIQLGSTITGSGVPAGTTITQQQSGAFGKDGVYLTNVATDLTDITLTFTVGPTVPIFPDFVPIIPPPPIGGTAPAFPPPAIPPPAGPLVGPAIASASVPPSVAGFPQPQFGSGDATTPPSYFEEFTTIFPVPTVVFTNAMNDGTTPPPQTASTENIVEDGWGPSVPPGAPTAPGDDGRLPRP